jgi:hypothetical protein
VSVARLNDLSIQDIVNDHAAAAIRTQQALDRAAAASLFSPPRMRVSQFEFSSDWGLEISTSAAFEIKAVPLNLSYRISRRLTNSTDLRISVLVEQLPVTTSPSTTTGE